MCAVDRGGECSFGIFGALGGIELGQGVEKFAQLEREVELPKHAGLAFMRERRQLAR